MNPYWLVVFAFGIGWGIGFMCGEKRATHAERNIWQDALPKPRLYNPDEGDPGP